MPNGPSTQAYSRFLQSQATFASNQDPFNYDELRKATSEAAKSTRTVGGTSGFNEAAKMSKRAYVYGKGSETKAALSKGAGDIQALQGQADKAAAGIKLMGAGTEAYMRRLQAVQDQADNQFQSAADNWNRAAEKADEVVMATRARVSEHLTILDNIHKEITKNRDFAQAHAMQAGVQATLGSMAAEERNLAYNYGDKELEQFHQSKSVALATMQSNIYKNSREQAEETDRTFIMASNEALWKGNMYTGFAEQQHVEMLKYATESSYTYFMQKAQFDISMEQMRMQGVGKFASWITDSPDFNYDAMPLVAVMSDMIQAGVNATAAMNTGGPKYPGPFQSRIA